MKNPALHWVRLPLTAVENCRELGGYATVNGEQTAWHTFLRSSDLTHMTVEDITFLEQYGVKHVIDLRSEEELLQMPNPFATTPFVNYYHIPLIEGKVSNLALAQTTFTMGHMYTQMLKESPGIAKVLMAMAQQEGVTLFHCSAGKDRTGVIAMLLLALAGVDKKDIISNYEVTYSNLVNMREKYADMRDKYPNVQAEMMYSKPEYIEEAYEYITVHHDTVEQYLLHIGVTADAIKALKTRFILQPLAVV